MRKSMVAPQLIAIIAAGMFMGGFAGNEFSHGGFAESMGMGHHHMTDYGGYHCADPSDDEHWADHVEHMHDGSVEFDEHCNGAHMTMDHEHIGGGMNDPMGPGHDGMNGGMGGGMQ